MDYQTDIFNKTMRIFLGTNSNKITEYPTLIHIQSVFDGVWYNFITPKVELGDFNLKLAKKIIKQEAEIGKTVGYYINQAQVGSYKKYLKDNGYQELGLENYLVKTMKQKVSVSLEKDFQITNNYQIEEVAEMLSDCFPTWPEEKQYARQYEQYKKNPGARMFETFCIKTKDKIVAAGSIVIDPQLNLAYLHNAGTLSEYRKKGLHTALVNQRCNYAFENGVNQICSIVDDQEGSFFSLTKNKFQSKDKLYLFGQ